MKILQVPVRYPPYVGGVENYCMNLSKEIVSMGHEVTVLAANEPQGKTYESVDGVSIKRLSYVGKVANTNITPSLPYSLYSADCDLIHAHLPTPWSADWAAMIAAVKNKPLVLTYHNDITGKGMNKAIAGTYNKTLLKLLLRKAKKIIVTNESYVSHSEHLAGYKDKIEVIPPGVDVRKFKPGEIKERNSMFFLSVLDEYHGYKGLEVLLDALRLVKKGMPEVKLIVGGDGSMKQSYVEKSARLDLEDNVMFTGHVPDSELPLYYSQSEAFILPSISRTQEGYGMVLLEAMACGTPVITTDMVGLAGEIRQKEIGRVAKANDPDSLAQEIICLLSEKGLRRQMALNARKTIEEKYGWDKIAKRVSSLYEEVA